MDRAHTLSRAARVLAVTLLFSLSSLSWAREVLPMSSQQTVQPGSRIDTRSFFPQVNETMGQRRIVPPNPERPGGILGGPANSLVSGTSGGISTANVQARFPGMTSNGYLPPDPQIAVSDTHIVQVVNSAVAFYSRSGRLEFRQDFAGNGFFAGLKQDDFIFDPKVFFDPGTGRFFLVALEVDFSQNLSHILLAVSDDSNPNGSWNRFRVDVAVEIDSNRFWLDYPGFGFNKDGVVVTGNMFGFGAGDTFVQALLFRKDEMTENRALTVSRWNVSTVNSIPVFTIQAAKSRDLAVDYIYGSSLVTETQIAVYAWANILSSTPQLVAQLVPVPAFRLIGSAPMTGGARLDTISGRLLDATYNNGSLMVAHTTQAATGQRRSQVTWYEVDPGTWPVSGIPDLRQAGDIALPGSFWAFQPAIAMNDNGDVSVVFTRTSAQSGADGMIATRRASDTPGRMGTPLQITSAPFRSTDIGRWGDYFTVDIDPLDGTTFWGVHQIVIPSGSWTTNITSWRAATSGGLNDPLALRPDSITTSVGTFVQGDVADASEADDDSTYDVDSVQRGREGQFASVDLTFESPFSRFDAGTMDVILRAFASPGRTQTGTVFLFNVDTGRWDFVRSFSTNQNPGTFRATVTSRTERYIDGDRVVRVRFRQHDPVKRRGTNATPFRMKADAVQMSIVSG